LSYLLGYILCGGLFLGGIIAYWLVTRPLRDPDALYLRADGTTPAPAARPGLGGA
jgi:hypothetical protein